MAVKSTRTLGYNLTGFLDKENRTIVEISDDEEVIHYLDDLLEPFDGEEIRMSFSQKVKLEDGAE